MGKRHKSNTTLLLIILLYLTSGCSSQEPLTDTTSDQGAFLEATQTGSDTTSVDHATQEKSQTNPSGFTPTPDNRLQPEHWQDWPVIPALSTAMIELYNRGLEMGNRDNAFSKVGDCQIIPDVFLGIYDNPTYALPEDVSYLQETLDFFKGSFAREGYALKGGFVFPTVFSPLRADSSICEPGETPYECELRVHQPAFVLISMEFRYDGRTAETHEKYLRRAVEYALERGIIPILATKADNFEGDHSLNLTTAKIAYEYDLPLWNYWKAVQHLPDHGIDWDRDSYGFHVTRAAWGLRSETFLQVLDALVKDIQAHDQGSAQLPQATQTPETKPDKTTIQTEKPTALPMFQGDFIEDWGKGRLIFDLKERVFGQINHLGVYMTDLESENLIQIRGEDSQVWGISSDYQLILTSNGPALSILQLDDQSSIEISNSFFTNSPSGAVWDETANQIYFVSTENGGTSLKRYDWNSRILEAVTSQDPVSVLHASDGIVVWVQGSCNPLGDCNFESLHWTDSEGNDLASREISGSISLPCQTSYEYVYAERDENDGLSFHIQPLGETAETIFWALNTEYADCSWSPDHQKIAVILIDRGWYSGVIQEYHFQILDPDHNKIQDLSFVHDLMDRVIWSPDGKYIAFSGTHGTEKDYKIDISLLKLDTLDITRLEHLSVFQSENYLAVNHLFWLP